MSQVDTGRRTPYEMVFGSERFAETEFPAIEEEAESRGTAMVGRDDLASLARVGALLQTVAPEASEPSALTRYLDILFHGFRFWKAGCSMYAFEEPVLRSLVERAPDLSGWAPSSPAPSIYIELPKNLFWADAVEGQPPEPVEGLFVAVGSDAAKDDLRILAVLGMRADRPGFSVIEVVAPPEEAKTSGNPTTFRSEIPGADLAQLYSLARPSEILLIVMRMLWYVDVYGEAIQTVAGAAVGSAELDEPGQPGPTSLDHQRVSLVTRAAEAAGGAG